jgi:hypothetical protein
MAFKLTRAESRRRDGFVAELESAGAALSVAVAAFNETLAQAREALEQARDAYNEKLEEVREFVEDIASSREAEISERSERWQESDKAQAAQQWVEDWQGLDLEPVHIDITEDLDGPDLPHRDELEALPEAAE